MKDRNWLEVDVGAVRSNISLAKSCIGDKKLIGIVKADCYGLGAELAIYLEDMLDSFGVATLEEALSLRQIGICKDILVLGGVKAEKANINKAIKNNLTLSLSDCESASRCDSLAREIKERLKVHLAVDSGMSRWGFLPEKYDIEKVFSLKNLDIEGVYSHLVKADEKNDDKSAAQMRVFSKLCERLKKNTGFDGLTHILNSAGIFRYPDAYGNAARLGIAMYGYAPSEYFYNVGLEECVRWYARIVSVRRVKKGTGVSYGSTYVSDKDTTLATVAAGYADGYPRVLSGRGRVFFNKKTYPVVGRVCMDQFVTDAGDDDLKTDDIVELAGKNIRVAEIARKCDSINYEILSRISNRTERFYINVPDNIKNTR